MKSNRELRERIVHQEAQIQSKNTEIALLNQALDFALKTNQQQAAILKSYSEGNKEAKVQNDN